MTETMTTMHTELAEATADKVLNDRVTLHFAMLANARLFEYKAEHWLMVVTQEESVKERVVQ